ncbi:MAG: methylated-DNA--[protein]-cysteine S-methyltransferase [Alkalilacustris sp.]
MDATATAEEDAYHYRLIARAIAEIDAAPPGLSLEALAGRIGLSPAHFQRVFTRWAGVTPKQYQQYLTLEAARAMLAARHTVFDTALAAGLSGPGRLHDLFLRWEAMPPGAYARAGAGLTIRHGAVDTPFGPAIAMATDHGLCGLALTAEMGTEAAFDDLAARWPAARFVPDPGSVAPPVRAAFDGAPAKLHLIGAPLRLKVWEALLAIPEGHVTTYGDLATAVGRPSAVRAVASAVGRNPIAALIPCHRVLRRDGALGGYHWGLPVKRALLAREAARIEAV